MTFTGPFAIIAATTDSTMGILGAMNAIATGIEDRVIIPHP